MCIVVCRTHLVGGPLAQEATAGLLPAFLLHARVRASLTGALLQKLQGPGDDLRACMLCKHSCGVEIKAVEVAAP